MGAPEVTVEKGLYSSATLINVPLSLSDHLDGGWSESTEGKVWHKGEPCRTPIQQLIKDTLASHGEFDPNPRNPFASLINQIRGRITAVHTTKKPTFLEELLPMGRSFIFCLPEWIPSRAKVIDQYHLALAGRSGRSPAPPPDRL